MFLFDSSTQSLDFKNKCRGGSNRIHIATIQYRNVSAYGNACTVTKTDDSHPSLLLYISSQGKAVSCISTGKEQ
jgi:hypothetical protein